MSAPPQPDRLEQMLASVVAIQDKTESSYQACAALLAEKSLMLDNTCERIKAHVEYLQSLIQEGKHHRTRLISQQDQHQPTLDEVSIWLKRILRDPRYRLDQF